eukprot:1340261-Amorphochlora_amoeboformis.AAC.2
MVTSTGLLLGFMVPLSIVAVDMQHSFQPPFHPNGVPFWRHGAGAFINESFIRLTPGNPQPPGCWNLTQFPSLSRMVNPRYGCDSLRKHSSAKSHRVLLEQPYVQDDGVGGGVRF